LSELAATYDMKLQDQQATAEATTGGRGWLEKLQDELLALLAPIFCQARSRLAAFAYLRALLAAPGDRRSCWQPAEAAGHATPRRMQALLSAAPMKTLRVAGRLYG
jgi:hypothetical protein